MSQPTKGPFRWWCGVIALTLLGLVLAGTIFTSVYMIGAGVGRILSRKAEGVRVGPGFGTDAPPR